MIPALREVLFLRMVELCVDLSINPENHGQQGRFLAGWREIAPQVHNEAAAIRAAREETLMDIPVPEDQA